MEIRLTPTGRWEASEDETESAMFAPLRKAFQADWRRGSLRWQRKRSVWMMRRPCATGRPWQNSI